MIFKKLYLIVISIVIKICTLGVFPALTFVADFPTAAPKFPQRMHRVRLKNLGTTDKKSSHQIKHKKIPRVHKFEQEERKMNKQKKIGLAVLVVILLYAAISVFFQYHYFIGTKVNGYSCGFRSVSKTKEMIKEDIKAYKITIKERNKKKESISFSQVNLVFKDDGKLEGIKAQQKGYAWITALFQSQDYRDAITLTMDDTAFNDTYNNLNAFNKDMVVAPVDAYSTYDKATNSYSIVPEVYGNTVKKKKLKPLLKEAILNMDKSIDIEKNDCYKNPAYKKDTKEVVEANKTMNKYVQETITYDFDDRTEELKGKKISKWLYETDKHEVKVHSEMAAKYIKKLADKYDTVGIKRNFTSICGNKVSVSGGTYGWRIDQKAETKNLVKTIKKGKSVKIKPEYAHRAKSRKKFDIGSTYVEVSLGEQHMWFYKNGKTLVSTDVVTGDISKGHGTPTGVYYILYKTTDYTLTGQGYASHVDYWLPFIQIGVGIHDSSWRGSYGGGIFTYDGSHGCVNTPRSAVQKIYNNIESTYPVVVHW